MQLSILGYILVPIFTYNMWELVLAYSCAMALIGAYEAVSRPAYSFKVAPTLAHASLCTDTLHTVQKCRKRAGSGQGPTQQAWDSRRNRRRCM